MVIPLLITAEECARSFLDDEYEPTYRQFLEEATQLDWNYNTRITDENAAAAVNIF